MQWIILLSIFIFEICPGQEGKIPNEETDNRIYLRSANVLVGYAPRDEKQALLVASWLNEGVNKLNRFYEIVSSKLIKIEIAESPEEFRALAQQKLPDWTGALFIPSSNTIILKSSRFGGTLFSLQQDLIHELSHAYFHQKFDDLNIPLWYNEGIAMWLSKRRIGMGDAITISNALWAKRIIPLSAIDSLLQFDRHRAYLAYLESLSAIQFMIHRLSEKQTLQDFQNLIVQKGWAEAVKSMLGMDEIDLEIQWYRYIEKKYKWMIVLNLENFLWVALIIILFLSVYAIRYRNRKKMQEWELQERAYFDQYWQTWDEDKNI